MVLKKGEQVGKRRQRISYIENKEEDMNENETVDTE